MCIYQTAKQGQFLEAEGKSAEEILLPASLTGRDLHSIDCDSSSPSEPHLLRAACPPHTVSQGLESAFNPISSTIQTQHC